MCLERNGNEEVFFSKNFPAVVWFLEKKKGNFKNQVQFSIQFLLYFPKVPNTGRPGGESLGHGDVT